MKNFLAVGTFASVAAAGVLLVSGAAPASGATTPIPQGTYGVKLTIKSNNLYGYKVGQSKVVPWSFKNGVLTRTSFHGTKSTYPKLQPAGTNTFTTSLRFSDDCVSTTTGQVIVPNAYSDVSTITIKVTQVSAGKVTAFSTTFKLIGHPNAAGKAKHCQDPAQQTSTGVTVSHP